MATIQYSAEENLYLQRPSGIHKSNLEDSAAMSSYGRYRCGLYTNLYITVLEKLMFNQYSLYNCIVIGVYKTVTSSYKRIHFLFFKFLIFIGEKNFNLFLTQNNT